MASSNAAMIRRKMSTSENSGTSGGKRVGGALASTLGPVVDDAKVGPGEDGRPDVSAGVGDSSNEIVTTGKVCDIFSIGE